MREAAHSILSSESGQAQLVTAMVMGVVMMSAGLYSLQRTGQVNTVATQISHRSQMRAALEEGAKFASRIFHDDVGCDPVLLDQKLSLLDPNGSGDIRPISNRPASGGRQIFVDLDGFRYRVAFGAVTPTVTPSPWAPGVSTDTVVEIWTHRMGGLRQTTPGTTELAGQRMVQWVSLINNCTYPCSATYLWSDGGSNHPVYPCELPDAAAMLQGRAYFKITDPAAFAAQEPTGLAVANACGRYAGDVDDMDCTGARTIDIIDAVVLRNYLRSGEVHGSCARILAGGALAPTDPSVAPNPVNPRNCQDLLYNQCGTGTFCADLNRDGMVTESDLNVLEKMLRGYLNVVPVRRW